MHSLRAWPLRVAARLAAVLPRGMTAWIYRLGPVTRAIRSSLNRAAPRGRIEVQIASGLLAGTRFALNLREEKDLWLGTYEPELQQALERVLRPGMTVYDLGAHIGYWSVAIGRLVGSKGRVHAFEPHPENLERLREVVAMNGLADRVSVVPKAAGPASGTDAFLLHSSRGMGKLAGSSGRQAVYEGALNVQVVALDDYCYRDGQPPPDWMKIDVEGGEVRLLEGARRLLAEARPGLLLELHGRKAAEGVWRVLVEQDYRLADLTGREVADPRDLAWKAYTAALPLEWEDGPLVD